MKKQNLTLFFFSTPKRSFYKKVKNTQEALAIFMQDCGKLTMDEISFNGYQFKALPDNIARLNV